MPPINPEWLGAMCDVLEAAGSGKGFGEMLGMGSSIRAGVPRPEGGLEVEYTMPTGLTTGSVEEGTGRAPLSVMLALFDELSTVAIAAADGSYRPGVSVSLTAEWAVRAPPHHAAPPAGQRLLLRARATKIGRYLGFADASCHDAETGARPPARARHCAPADGAQGG